MISHNYKSGLEDWLDSATCERFLTQVKTTRRPPSLTYLTELLRACYSQIPFQNLLMLTRPRIPPTREQIITDMLNGLGGLCETHNFFFCALLHQLNFQVCLLSASMQQPDCHIGLAVVLDGQLYWVDLGNGYPYLTPLPIRHNASATHLGFNYELELKNSTVFLKQSMPDTDEKTINQSFNANPVHHTHFDQMRHQHYEKFSFGPFLSGIRINRWETKRGFLMRDRSLTMFPEGVSKIYSEKKCTDWIKDNFDMLPISLYHQSKKVLNENYNHQ